MRFKHLFPAIVLFLVPGLLQLAAQVKKSSASQAAPEEKRLIRLDLLDKPPAAGVRTLRNIFLLGRSGGEVPPPAGEADAGLRTAAELRPGGEEAKAAAAPEIRYIGYVASDRKVIGMILVAGQAEAVSQGDTIAGMYKVLKVGPEALELLEPDGRTITVSIEGARR